MVVSDNCCMGACLMFRHVWGHGLAALDMNTEPCQLDLASMCTAIQCLDAMNASHSRPRAREGLIRAHAAIDAWHGACSVQGIRIQMTLQLNMQDDTFLAVA